MCLKFSFAWLELQVLKLHGHSHVSGDLQLALEKCLGNNTIGKSCDGEDCQSEIHSSVPVEQQQKEKLLADYTFKLNMQRRRAGKELGENDTVLGP